MANIKNNSEKNDKQRSDFKESQELKSNVYDAIEEQLKKSSEKAFKSEGIKSNDSIEKNSQQGWNKGVYGDGSTYGQGVSKGKGTVTINRVKGSSSTNGFFEKNLSLGGKKMVVEIHVDIDTNSKTMDMTYQTTEQAAFRGLSDKKGPFMINDKLTFKLGDMTSLKKELEEKFDKLAESEVNYFIKTKLGIEDRTEKSINSMVESNMKKLSLSDIIKGGFDDTLNKIMESTKKDSNNPEVIAANSPGKLLFDDLEEAEEKKGKKYRDYFESKMKGFGAKSPKELKPSEFKTIDMGWCSDEEKSLEEIATSGGGAGGTVGSFAFASPFGTAAKKDFNDTNYSKKNQKRNLKRENVNGWTEVELEPGSGYVPKGMNKNYVSGLHSDNVEGVKKDKASLSEGFNPSKRKFITESENLDSGVNKRYIITHKTTSEEESNRWKRLSSFNKDETIKLAESCGGKVDDGTKTRIVSREEGEKLNKEDFIKRNKEIECGEELNGMKVVSVDKPNSITNATYKVFEDDYLNENKAFILDMKTGNLVNNPNYKSK